MHPEFEVSIFIATRPPFYRYVPIDLIEFHQNLTDYKKESASRSRFFFNSR